MRGGTRQGVANRTCSASAPGQAFAVRRNAFQLVRVALVLLAFPIAPAMAQTSLLIEFIGTSSPLTQGYTTGGFGPASTVGQLTNDLGHSAWFISGSSRASQFHYQSGALNTTQTNAMAASGFSLTFTARPVLDDAPVYDATNHVVLGVTTVAFAGKRWEVGLGLNSSGDIVAVLPSSIDNSGPGNAIRAPGAAYTLTGLGNGYHTYQLIYSAGNNSASLFVDGILRLSNYTGHTSFVSNIGLAFSADSGGQMNYVFAQLAVPAMQPVPEHGVLPLLGSGVGLLWLQRRRWRGLQRSRRNRIYGTA